MSLWLGVVASAGKKLFSGVAQFLYGTSNGKLYAINSGISEEVNTLNTAGSSINDIKYIPSTNTTLVAADDGKLFSSTNLTNWTTVNTGMTGNIRVVEYGGQGNFTSYFVGGD